MQYLKHYWINVHSGTYCCEDNPIEKRHPEAEFPGLGVKVWMHDEDGIEICLSTVPDSVTIIDMIDDHSGKKIVQKLTEVEFNSVQIPLTESQTLRQEAQQETDEELKAEKESAATAKFEEARQALFAL